MADEGVSKYDPEATLVQERTGGEVILIVLGGDRGDGWCAQILPEHQKQVPDLLRAMADQLEKASG